MEKEKILKNSSKEKNVGEMENAKQIKVTG